MRCFAMLRSEEKTPVVIFGAAGGVFLNVNMVAVMEIGRERALVSYAVN